MEEESERGTCPNSSSYFALLGLDGLGHRITAQVRKYILLPTLLILPLLTVNCGNSLLVTTKNLLGQELAC